MRQLLPLMLILSFACVNSASAQSPGGVGTSDLYLWLKADAGISPNDNGDLVALWEDQSPNGNDATQTDPAAQPIFQNKRINGYPALKFNFANQFMDAQLAALSDRDFTIFIVAKRTNGSANSFLMGTNNATGNGFEWGLPNETTVRAEQLSSSNDQTIPPYNVDEVPMIFQTSNDPSSGLTNMVSRSGINYNGRDATAPGTDELTGFIGKNNSSQGFRGYIAEVIIFDRGLIFSETNAVRTYLSTKYGMTITTSENSLISDPVFNNGTFALEVDADQGINMTNSKSEESSTIAKVKSINTLDEDEHLIIGHNNNPLTFSASGMRCGMDEICDRQWKLESNFIPSSMNLEFDFSDYPSIDLEKMYMLIDVNNNGYADDKITYGNINGSKITFNTRGITNDNQFTLALGHTKWHAMVSGLSTDPIWSPTGSTSDLQVPPSCEHLEYTITSGATVDAQSDMEMYNLDILGGLVLNNHKLTIYNDLTNDGVLTAGTSSIKFESADRVRLKGTSITTLYDLTYDGSIDLRVQVPELRLENVLLVQNGVFKTGNKVVLLSNADRTAMVGPITGTGAVSGKVTAQRYHNAGNNGYVMMGTPVKTQKITDLNDHLITTGFVGSDWPSYPFNNIKSYNESVSGIRDEGFVGTTGLDQNLVKGKGLMIYMQEGGQFIDLNGRLWTGDQDLPVSYTDTSNPLEDGWNLVANPYACTINWDIPDPAWTKVNLEDAIYVFDADLQVYGSYVNGVGNNGGSGNIVPFQAFWTKANAADPQLTITELAKNPIQADFKDAPAIPLRIALGSGNHIDEATFYYSDQASPGFDSELEAEKFYAENSTSIASSSENGMMLSIQALTTINENINIPLEVLITTSRSWSFTAEGWDQLQNARCAYLHDAETNSDYALGTGELVSIDLEEGTYTDRFSLVVSTSVLSETNNPTCYNSNDGSILVSDENLTQIDWFNSNNELLLSSEMNESSMNNLEPGVYQINMSSNGICSSLSAMVILEEPSPLMTDAEIILPSCPESNDGTIIIDNMGGTLPYNVSWNTGEENSSLFELGTGVYESTLTDANGCQLVESYNLSAQNNPEVQFEAPSIVMLEGGIAVVPFVNSSTSVESYLWDLGDGNFSIEEQPTHIYSEPGIYSVTLVGTAGQCSQTREQTISVQSPVGIESSVLEENTSAIWTDQGLIIKQGGEQQTLMINVYNVLGQKLANTVSGDQETQLAFPRYIQHILVEIQTLDGSSRITYNLVR